MRLTPPQQLSSVPDIDRQAVAWAGSLADGLAKLRLSQLIYGTATLTWPGGQAFSTALTVTHGLPATVGPRAVFCQVTGSTPGLTAFPVIVATMSGSSFVAQGWTIDEQLPANGSTAIFYWVAIAGSG